MKKTLLHSALLLVFLGMANNLLAQERGQFSIFANFGGGTLEDTKIALTPDNSAFSSRSPAGLIFSVGAMLELRLLFSKTKYRAEGDIEVSSNFESIGLGFAFGPYFRLNLWGPDKTAKKAGIGLAPYFLINALRPELEESTQIAGGSPTSWADRPVVTFGTGLMLDVYLTKNFGINLGAEIQGGDSNSTYKDGEIGATITGPTLYGGVIVSF